MLTNYFDYIHESSQEDVDDLDSIYNETDLALIEFDSYVQEGAGLKILARIGLVALIGAFIGVIVHLVSNNSETSASVAVARAKYMSKLGKQYGVEKVKFDGFLKGGWLSHRGMRIFNVILNSSDAYTCIIEDIVSHLSTMHNNITNEEKVAVKRFIDDKYAEAKSKAARASAGALAGLDISFDTIQNTPPKEFSERAFTNFGENGEKTIVQIDDRLKDLSTFIKDFKGLIKRLKEQETIAKELKNTHPILMASVWDKFMPENIADVLKYVEDANQVIIDSSNAIYDAIKSQKHFDEILDSFSGM